MSGLVKKLINYAKMEKSLLINVSLAFFIRGISLIISTFSLPLYIRYFDNNETLGVWYTLLSVLTWINMCDLGLGNGLRNKLTEALWQNNRLLCKQYVSSTYILLISIIVPVVSVLSIATHYIDFNDFLNISSDVISISALQKTMRILFCGIGIYFVLKVINSIIYSLQISSVNNLISLITSIIPLIFVFVYEGSSVEQNLIMLAYFHIIAINVPLLVASVIIFTRKSTHFLCPGVHFINNRSAKMTLGLGMKFFVAQIFFMFLMSTNEIFLSSIYSPDNVVSYNIYYKLFMVIGSLFMLALTPIWSKVTKDITEKKYYKLKITNDILYLLSLAAIVAEFIMVFVLQFIINIWLGPDAIIVDYEIAIIFAVFGGSYILNIVLTTIANGIGELKSQIVFYGLGSFFKLPACLIMAKIGIGWHGIVMYNSMILIVFCIYQFTWVNRRVKSLITDSTC